jgi:hypothetical protein
MNDELSIYQCEHIINQIEAIAAANEGEIPEEKLAELVKAQTTSMTKLNGLVGFMRFIEHRLQACKMEEERIARIRKTATNRLESIERYLLPFVQQYKDEHGHPLSVGTFTLLTRKSESVVIADDAQFSKDRPDLCRTVTTVTPDKIEIRKQLKAGQQITGASLQENVSLQLK